MRVEEAGNFRNKRPRGPCAYGCLHSTEIFSLRDRWIFEREVCHQNIRQASGVEEAVLGKTFLGERVLCKHGRPRRRKGASIREMATREGQTHRATKAF